MTQTHIFDNLQKENSSIIDYDVNKSRSGMVMLNINNNVFNRNF